MLQDLHHHRLNRWHFNKWEALLEQLFKLPVSIDRRKEQKKKKVIKTLVPSASIQIN